MSKRINVVFPETTLRAQLERATIRDRDIDREVAPIGSPWTNKHGNDSTGTPLIQRLGPVDLDTLWRVDEAIKISLGLIRL